MTIAQQLNITEFPFSIKNTAGQEIYYENSFGYWTKSEYDANGNTTRYEKSTGYWLKMEYDANGKLVYKETQDGIKLDKRPKTELTLDEIAAKFGIPVSQLKIKK